MKLFQWSDQSPVTKTNQTRPMVSATSLTLFKVYNAFYYYHFGGGDIFST